MPGASRVQEPKSKGLGCSRGEKLVFWAPGLTQAPGSAHSPSWKELCVVVRAQEEAGQQRDGTLGFQATGTLGWGGSGVGVCVSPGLSLPFWMVSRRVTVRPVRLGSSRRTSELCWAGARSLTLGPQGGRLRRGCRQGRRGNSRVLGELLPAGLAGASRRVVVILLQPPWEVTTGIGEGPHISTLELFGEEISFLFLTLYFVLRNS